MATITEKSKGNKVVSFKFHCCIGRDEQGKQHFRTATLTQEQARIFFKALNSFALAFKKIHAFKFVDSAYHRQHEFSCGCAGVNVDAQEDPEFGRYNFAGKIEEAPVWALSSKVCN